MYPAKKAGSYKVAFRALALHLIFIIFLNFLLKKGWISLNFSTKTQPFTKV